MMNMTPTQRRSTLWLTLILITGVSILIAGCGSVTHPSFASSAPPTPVPATLTPTPDLYEPLVRRRRELTEMREQLQTPNLDPYPTMHSPVHLSASDRTVVWHSAYRWWGYDLVLNELFPVSPIPPEWKDMPIVIAPVTITQDQLFWTIIVNEEEHHFSAPILFNQ